MPRATNQSKAEERIEKYLKTNKHAYLREESALEVRCPETDSRLRYDFELRKEKVIIEFHGMQHFVWDIKFFPSKSQFTRYQARDIHKRTYALNKGYAYVELVWSDLESGKFRKYIQDAIKQRESRILSKEDKDKIVKTHFIKVNSAKKRNAAKGKKSPYSKPKTRSAATRTPKRGYNETKYKKVEVTSTATVLDQLDF